MQNMQILQEYGEGVVYEQEDRQQIYDEFWQELHSDKIPDQTTINLNPVRCLKNLD
jgi:hypothetical protein